MPMNKRTRIQQHNNSHPANTPQKRSNTANDNRNNQSADARKKNQVTNRTETHTSVWRTLHPTTEDKTKTILVMEESRQQEQPNVEIAQGDKQGGESLGLVETQTLSSFVEGQVVHHDPDNNDINQSHWENGPEITPDPMQQSQRRREDPLCNDTSLNCIRTTTKTTSNRDFRGGQAAWQAMLYHYLLFQARNGHSHVRYDSHDPDTKALYQWIMNQRKNYKLFMEGKKSLLNQDRIQVLQRIEFPFQLRGDTFWPKHYESLKLYKEEHGNTLVPRNWKQDPKLGDWVTDQRRQYKLKRSGDMTSMLTDEKERLLNDIAFTWVIRPRTEWNSRYQELIEFQVQHHHVNVPQHYPVNRSLGKWVAKQREQYKLFMQGKYSFLNEERIELLNRVGFTWIMKGAKKDEHEKRFERQEQEASALSSTSTILRTTSATAVQEAYILSTERDSTVVTVDTNPPSADKSLPL